MMSGHRAVAKRKGAYAAMTAFSVFSVFSVPSVRTLFLIFGTNKRVSRPREKKRRLRRDARAGLSRRREEKDRLRCDARVLCVLCASVRTLCYRDRPSGSRPH